ncbi:DREV methyltransferase [Angomonas deanei]|nr:DREV methyltransferase [Angomonas deanei]|eukprot:EPY42435.1 DREV methyltransferase [Angomonas deanei]
MYVFSTEQARRLLRPVGVSLEEYEAGKGTEAKFEKLLDIGAGDGGVTAKLEPLMGDVRNIFATEYSRTMRWRLGRRGYTVLGHENPFEKVNPTTQQPERSSYDLIALLNVLDRIDTPLDILQNIHASLTPSGYLLLAVVLPWCPFVEEGKRQVRPSQSLPMDGGKCCEGAKFEDSFSRLVENVLEPAGFELVRWTKLPYLCQGNLKLEYAVLHDAVMVLRKKEEQAP